MMKGDTMDNKFYVYLHRDDSGMVRYIGKGYGRRAYEFNKKARNVYWHRVFKNTKPNVEIAIANLSEEHAFELETMLYDIFLADGHKLTNLVRPDGQGVSGELHYNYGKKHSDETRKKMSDAHRGKNNSFYGRRHTEHAKKKLSEALEGEKSSFAKLTEKEVLEIRELYATGNYTQKELGLKYNISPYTINGIIKRRRWKHI